MAPIIKRNLIQSKHQWILQPKFIIFFAIIFSPCNGFPSETVSENICNTPECHQTASEVLKDMDATINPCDNFYKFACGNYLKNTKIPDTLAYWNPTLDVREKTFEQLKLMVTANVSSNSPKHVKLAKTYYDICMNETAIKEHGWAPLKEKFKKLGGWPVLEGSKWNESAFDLTNLFKTLRELGYYHVYPFDFYLELVFKNKTEKQIQLTLQKLPIDELPFEQNPTINDQLLINYKKIMTDSAVLLGADRDYANQEFYKLIEFEKFLGMIKRRNSMWINAQQIPPMTVAEIQKMNPSIPWLNLLNITYPHLNPDKNSTIYYGTSEYFSYLEWAMNTFSKRTIANYILWKVFFESHEYLSDQYQRPLSNTSRSEYCFNDINNSFDYNLDILYAKTFSKRNTKKNVAEIVNNIQSQLKSTLQTLDWMNQEDKKHSIDKLEAMKNLIAYDDQLLDDGQMAELYKNFELHENMSYLDAKLNAEIFRYNLPQHILYQKTFVKNTGRVIAADIDAKFTQSDNTLKIPAGLLQGRIYNASQPQYMNYGAIGCTIGHETTHGFDMGGRHFNKDGVYTDMWAPSTNAEYDKKILCIQNQYSNYTVQEVGMNVNGELTIKENIADNGGYKLAYLAYKNWASLNGPELRLPGLERFSPSQMFWISSAQYWCTVSHPYDVQSRLGWDNHSPSEFRVIGAFSNIKEFSEDFQCPLESPMNPKNKCTVW